MNLIYVVDDKVEKFKLISNKLRESNIKFKEFKSIINPFEKFKKIEVVINLNEINPLYNFELLNLQKELKINSNNISYKENMKILGPTLSNEQYTKLTGKRQKNPAAVLFALLNLYLIKPESFDKATQNLNQIKYNIPLIEGNERTRINYYLSLFLHYNLLLDDEQEAFIQKENRLALTKKEKIAEKYFNKYNSIKEGITKFKDIIPRMENFFNQIKLDSFHFDKKLYYFILSIIELINYVEVETEKDKYLLNLFRKEIDPLYDINNAKGFIFKKGSLFIKKVNNNINDYTYVIHNDYETISFNAKNYIMENLIKDFNTHSLSPLNYILARNKSMDYFFKTNKNILDDDDIYKEFLIYFKNFIKSKCFEEFLSNENVYENIIPLIKREDIIDKFLDKKYLIPAPFFEFIILGFTNKDILVSFIIGKPILLNRFSIKNEKEYNNLKNLIFLFNVGIKLIIFINEFVIHLLYGYIYYVSENKISFEYPKGNKSNDDGGLFFEKRFFGREMREINLQEIIALINEESLESYEKFKNNFNKEYEGFTPKSNLAKANFKKYPINFQLNQCQQIYGKNEKFCW